MHIQSTMLYIYIYIYRGGILSLSLSLLCKEVKNLSLFSLQKNNNGDKQKKRCVFVCRKKNKNRGERGHTKKKSLSSPLIFKP